MKLFQFKAIVHISYSWVTVIHFNGLDKEF